MSHELVLDLATAMGTSRVTLRVPEGPLTLAALVPFAQALTGTLVERAVERQEAEGRTISCRAGCGACCRQLVPLSIPECFALADVIVAMDEPRRDAILARFDALEARVAKTGLLPALEAAARGETTDAQDLGFRYLALGIPCVFLEEESCSIHPERPTACRDYLVTSPASHCASQGKLPLFKVPTPVLLSEVLARVTARLLGEPPVVVSMTVAMGWVDSHTDLAFRTWPSLELMRVLLEELGVAVPWRRQDG